MSNYKTYTDIRDLMMFKAAPSWQYKKDGFDVRVVLTEPPIYTGHPNGCFHIQGIPKPEEWTAEFIAWTDGITRGHMDAHVMDYGDTITEHEWPEHLRKLMEANKFPGQDL